MFCVFDDSSTIVAPEELGSFGSRVRTMQTGYAYDRRVSIVEREAHRRLNLAAEEDDWDAPRETLTFALGSGMTWLDGDDGVSNATSKDGNVTVLFKGDFMVQPVHTEDDAHSAFVRGEDHRGYMNPSNAQRMLDFYQWSDGLNLDRGSNGNALNPAFAVEKLRQLSGGFAFVLYDRKRHRLVAARDAAGHEELYWGVASDGEGGSSLMFASSAECPALGECAFSSTLFPKGTVLLSQGGVAWRSKTPSLVSGPHHPGTAALHSFARPERPVRAVPRLNSSGMLCGAVFRVESIPDLAAAGSDVRRTPSQIELSAM